MKVYCVFELQSDPECNLFFDMHGVAASIASAKDIVAKKEEERLNGKWTYKWSLDDPEATVFYTNGTKDIHRWIPFHPDMNADNAWCAVASREYNGDASRTDDTIDSKGIKHRYNIAYEGYIIEEMEVSE